MWKLHITHLSHNYTKFYNSATYATHHIDNCTDEQMAEIKHSIHAELYANQIFSQMHIYDSNILLRPINIQNVKFILHQYNLGCKTSIQTLIHQLINFPN